MKVEKRRYKIKGFREDGDKIRILLLSDDPVKVSEKPDVSRMMENPMGFAQKLMNKSMQNIIHDSFSISKEEYHDKKYMVGETVSVHIFRE